MIAETPRTRGAARFLRSVHGRALPRLIGTMREPTWIFYETVLPLLGSIAFVYVYRALGAPKRFEGYVIMGGAASTIWANVMWSMASQLWWEKKDGNLELYMTSPCGLVPILLGMSVGGLYMATIRAVLVVTIGSFLFDITYSISNVALFVLVFALAVVALYGLGIMLSSLFLLWGREAWHTTNLFAEPVYLLSGFYFPVRSLGFATGMIASVIPLTVALDAMRQMLYPDSHPRLLPIGTEIAILVGLGVLFAALARLSLRKMEYLARREGRLSTRL